MDPKWQRDLDPTKDDLPLRANTNHILVRHYVLDLSVDFQRQVIDGSIVLFLDTSVGRLREQGSGSLDQSDQVGSVSGTGAAPSTNQQGPQLSEKGQTGSSDLSWTDESEDFTLILDCCDLLVSKVEELDVSRVLELQKLLKEEDPDQDLSSVLLQRLISLPSFRWKEQQELYLQCSSAPAVSWADSLLFHTDQWSLQVRRRGVRFPEAFPSVLRIWYQTKPTGGSVRWTKDQDDRCCVYTMGSPINNRALFPCQEPPVAMSTWQASIKAPSDFTVLLSGENQASPTLHHTGVLQWDYYVTMPMPASTFTVAVGMWREARAATNQHEDPCVKLVGKCIRGLECSSVQSGEIQNPCRALSNDSSVEEEFRQRSCSHQDYPCRFRDAVSWAQDVIPHRVFAPSCLLERVESSVLPLLPRCLTAAHAVLGVHPFSRLDVLLVPAGFSSLGMASPHIIFLSQSVLAGEGGLVGARLCHEIAHSWFGLAIGARDWTEEWISEGFATYLEDVFWAKVQQLCVSEAEEQRQLKSLLRFRRLRDELENTEEELQVLRPNRETTGKVSESGASMVKHALNPEKPFMQVHYLKGYFLLKFLSGEVGEQQFLNFFRLFVRRYHGQLILSQDFLQMFLDTFPALSSQGLTLGSIYSDWLDTPGIPKCLLECSSSWCRAPAVEEVRREAAAWMCVCVGVKRSKRKRAESRVNFKQLSSEQLVLLLEFLLEETELSRFCLSLMKTTYNLLEQDAEVKHRWCELVVKHKHTAAYEDVEHFLIHDQAMGVYLYGELMVQEDGRQQALARRCLQAVREQMDQSARSVVEEMIL